MLASVAILVTYTLLALPAAAVGLPWTLLSGDIGLLYRWASWIARTGLRAGGIRVEVEGRENLPAGRACIFMPNHVSNLDPPVLFPLLPFRTAFFLKRELMKVPLLGWGMRLGDFIPVARDGNVESAQESVRRACEVLAKGVNVVTFPEGTRSRTGRLQAFKKGPFYLAMESGAPVVPCSIQGTESMMRKGSLRIAPGTARVRFHPPVEGAQFRTREEMMEAVRAAIASGLPERMLDPETTA